ncbi:MAG: hypothetical protein K9G62_01685 [Alphaproteobacteria bacterium]|nr:hypothetical protein [Alphaproteobacteria bacterium]
MSTIPGASIYYASSALANARGASPSIPTLLGSTDTASLLESGRSFAVLRGVSSRARSVNAQYLSQSKSLGNQILSLALGSGATLEGAQQQILALRSQLPDSKLSNAVRGLSVDQDA